MLTTKYGDTCSYCILTSSLVNYYTEAWQHGINLLTCTCVMMNHCDVRVLFVAEPEMVEPTVTTSLS